MIGTFGVKLVFQVSDKSAQTFRDMSREVSGRWATHETMGAKAKSEYLGPGLQTISLTVYLSATLGVRPRAMLETIEEMVESGEAEYLILGEKPVGKNPYRIVSLSEAWDTIYSGGQLAKATVTLSLEEYT